VIAMKRILIIFLALLSTFISIWTVKAQTPTNRPDTVGDYAAGVWLSYDTTSEISAEWVLDPEIPENYLPVPGHNELYMVIDGDGRITGYRQRTRQEDGSWLWADVNPDIPEDYEPVQGLKDVYKVTAADGTVSYFKYIRNEDDTFAFISVDQYGNPLTKMPSGDEIPANYQRITGNIYAVLNEYGVIVGYKERRAGADGAYSWVDCDKPVIKQSNGETSIPGTTPNNPDNIQSNPSVQMPQLPSSSNIPDNSGSSTPGTIITPHSDGTYTETETLITTETAGGWATTYQTVVTRIFNERGVLLSTKKDGPKVLSKVKAGDDNSNAPDPSKIAKTLGEELARVSTGITYRPDLALEVLNELNTERAAQGLSALRMDSGSNACKIAQLLAADMAIYNHSDYDSPMYGTLADLLNRYGIKSAIPSENTWKTTTSKNAGAIHARFMTLEGARQARMSGSYTNIGIAIVQRNGYYYVCEILID